MHRCLYGQGGFYASGAGVAGRRGDFITSPEVGPLFGAVLARWLDVTWTELGRPDPFLVVDAGTGPGTLPAALARAAPECAAVWQLVPVDPADGTELPERLDGGVVIANELLDNLVFRIVVRGDAGGWHEVAVVDGTEQLIPLDPARLPAPIRSLPPGSRVPWHEAATKWIDDVIERGAARVLVFDYGTTTTAELAARGGWLRTYRQHRLGTDPYLEPGSCDITSDIAFDQLPPPIQLMTQAEFLIENGIEDLVAEGREHWVAHAARPDVTALMMRSRVREADALLDPSGLGGWLVARWGRGAGETRSVPDATSGAAAGESRSAGRE